MLLAPHDWHSATVQSWFHSTAVLGHPGHLQKTTLTPDSASLSALFDSDTSSHRPHSLAPSHESNSTSHHSHLVRIGPMLTPWQT